LNIQQKIQQGHYLPELDGLRGIAILLVIGYHYFPNWSITTFGWSGVDLFFVLSGFLISSRIIPYLENKNWRIQFYRNRFLRIAPLYFAFLVSFFLGWFLFTSAATREAVPFYREHGWTFFLFVQNWSFILHAAELKTHLAHLWSIAIEEQFYLVFPFLLMWLRKKKSIFVYAWLLLIVIMASRSYYYGCILNNQDFDKVYWNSFFRLDAFIIGYLLYQFVMVYHESEKAALMFRIISWLSLTVTVIAIWAGNSAGMYNVYFGHGGLTAVAIIYAYLVYSSINKEKSILARICRNRMLRFTGKISYGLYIFHWPFLFFSFALVNKISRYFQWNASEEMMHAAGTFIALLATYVVSFASFRYYESIFLRRKSRPAAVQADTDNYR